VKKKFIVALLAASVAALALAPAAVAKKPANHRPPVRFTLQGKVTDIAAGTDSTAITAVIWTGSQGLTRFHGQSIVLTATSATKVQRLANGKSSSITLADVKVNDRIRAWGRVTHPNPNTTTYTLTRLQVRSTWPITLQGPVVSVNTGTPPGTLTVTVRRASFGLRHFISTPDVTLTLTANAVLRKVTANGIVKITLDQIKTGDRVLVQGKVDNTDPSNALYFARWVLVKR
jgi:hypothetical protein